MTTSAQSAGKIVLRLTSRDAHGALPLQLLNTLCANQKLSSLPLLAGKSQSQSTALQSSKCLCSPNTHSITNLKARPAVMSCWTEMSTCMPH